MFKNARNNFAIIFACIWFTGRKTGWILDVCVFNMKSYVQ